ncbi:MAG TPA: alpha/beta hydrolase [Gemmatimonadaceae bacterium]|nr:alpha/beta hydrolase [Gemmatimonadaceae bacterium]
MRVPFLIASMLLASTLGAQGVPKAVFVDPPRDAKHPARMEVLHIPSGGVHINGVAMLAAGPGTHPTFVFCHGLPGNEKGHDLAQALRRAGWNAVTFNYRGSWGSPGNFTFDHAVEDAAAVLAYLRDTSNARALSVDTTRLVLGGHSMGGWAAAIAASRDARLRGAVLISLADMGVVGAMPESLAVPLMRENMESLAGGTAETFAHDLVIGAARRRLRDAARGLSRLPLLVLSSDDGLAPHSDSLVLALRRLGNARVTTLHAATDHSWSDRRIGLATAVLRWLDRLPASGRAR